MWLTRAVFRCFKCMERSADRVTGAVGPLFVTIAIVLLSMGIFTFCKWSIPHSKTAMLKSFYLTAIVDVVAPTLRLPWITTPICALIACNTVAHYYWAITVSPGFADEDALMSGVRTRARKSHSRFVQLMTAPTRRGAAATAFSHQLDVGRVGRCQKCGSMKPEVSLATIRWSVGSSGPLPSYSEHTIAEYANVAFSNTTITVL